VPNQDPKAAFPFILLVAPTIETLTFDPIGGLVPDRGLAPAQNIFYAGLTYLQQVSDGNTHAAMHIERGMWLNVPATPTPDSPATVVRLGTVPHGDSLLAQGTFLTVPGGPQIDPVNPQPTGPSVDQPYLDFFNKGPFPPGFDITNPNQALVDAIQGQNITETVVLIISTNPSQGLAPGGGILNIPFVTTNANVTEVDAIFWIEEVANGDEPFLQLQYTQTVILNFAGIDWPHVSVATLVKQ